MYLFIINRIGINVIQNYEKYLDKLSLYFEKFFTQQKPYICCKEGCSICCETGEYPFSGVEFKYAMIGFNSLTENKKNVIKQNVEKIKYEKEKSLLTGEIFMYACPFLIDKKCSIYEHRGLICRSYGLLYFQSDKEGNVSYKMPCCVQLGLNFSNVYDEKLKTISTEKWKETGIEEEPVSYNIGLDFLMNNKMASDLEIEFGKQKALIDWF